MRRWLHSHGLTSDWVAWLVGFGFVATLFCPYMTNHATATAKPAVATASVSKPGMTVPKDVTTLVQTRLRQYGYSVVVDGIYGPQTTAAVSRWQRSNGLLEDGIAGPATLRSMSLTGGFPATATVPAKRVDPPAPRGDTEQIIRDIWPDDIEDWAVRIAKRESSPALVVTAHNACCYGIFQIHFQAHRAWLGDYGVHQPSDLYDPAVNATVALALYMASSPHCQPWGC